LPGATIMSDGLMAYRTHLQPVGYSHYTVCHKDWEFASGSETHVHTNRIDGCWGCFETGSEVFEASERTGFLWRYNSPCGAIILVSRIQKTTFSTERSLFWNVTLIFDPQTMPSVTACSRCLHNFGLFHLVGCPFMYLGHLLITSRYRN